MHTLCTPVHAHSSMHRSFMWRAWGNTPLYLCFWSQHNIADHLRPFWSKLEIFFEKKYFFIQGFSAKKNQYFVRGGVIFEKKRVRYGTNNIKVAFICLGNPHVSGRAWNPTFWNYHPSLIWDRMCVMCDHAELLYMEHHYVWR